MIHILMGHENHSQSHSHSHIYLKCKLLVFDFNKKSSKSTLCGKSNLQNRHYVAKESATLERLRFSKREPNGNGWPTEGY